MGNDRKRAGGYGTVILPLLGCGLLFGVAGWGRGAAIAQPPGVVAPVPDARSPVGFQDVLQALSARLKVSLLAEDQPLNLELSPAEAAPLLAALKDEKLSDEEVIRRVAEAFDYLAIRHKPTVFLLKKRFTSPYDLPCVTPEEWGEASQDVIRVLKAYSPGITQFSKDPATRELIRSFSPEQLAALASEEGLPLASLNPAQKQAVWRCCLFFYVQAPFDKILDAGTQAHCVLNPETRFGWFDDLGSPVFGYKGPVPDRVALRENRAVKQTAREARFRPLGSPNQFVARTDGIVQVIRSANGGDPTDPGKDWINSNRADSLKADAPRPARPLVQVVGEWDRRRQGARGGASTPAPPYRLGVDPALAEKRVTLVGDPFTDPDTLFEAVAELYGLRITTDQDKNYRLLTRPRLRLPTDMGQLRAALFEILPQPFLRAALDLPAPGPATRALYRDEDNPNNPIRTPEKWRLAAVRLARFYAEPVLKQKKVDTLALAEIEPTGRIALANVLMADVMAPFRELVANPVPPPYIADFNRLVLKGGPFTDRDGERQFSLGLATRREDGSLRPCGGFVSRMALLEAPLP
jgi:hypothetical protein